MSELEMKGAAAESTADLYEDGEDDSGLPPRKGNLFGSTASLTKAIIGSGVLGLPKAFATSGWVLSLIVLAISGLLNAIGLYFVCVCGKKLNDRTANYGTLGWRTIKILAPIADFLLFMTCYGSLVSYLMIAGDSISMFVTGITGDTEGILVNRTFWITIAFVVFGVPLTCAKNINVLSYFSIFAVAFVWYIAVLIVLFYINPGTPALDACAGKPDPCVGTIEAFNGDILSFLRSMPTFVFALGCAPQILPVFNELKNPTIGRANMMIISTTVCVMVIYVAVAICGYFTYGDNVSSNILNDYPTTSIPATVARLGIGISVAVSYPLYAHPARQALMHGINLILEIAGKEEMTEIGHGFQRIQYWIITALLLASTYVLAIFVGDLGIVFSLVGSLAAANLGFTLPGLFYWYMHRGQLSPLMVFLSLFMFVFGLAFSILGAVFTFI